MSYQITIDPDPANIYPYELTINGQFVGNFDSKKSAIEAYSDILIAGYFTTAGGRQVSVRANQEKAVA